LERNLEYDNVFKVQKAPCGGFCVTDK